MKRVADPNHIDHLCPELKEILDAELASGNEVLSTYEGNPQETTVVVLLRYPFRSRVRPFPQSVRYRDIGDPDSWQAEYRHPPTTHALAYPMTA